MCYDSVFQCLCWLQHWVHFFLRNMQYPRKWCILLMIADSQLANEKKQTSERTEEKTAFEGMEWWRRLMKIVEITITITSELSNKVICISQSSKLLHFILCTCTSLANGVTPLLKFDTVHFCMMTTTTTTTTHEQKQLFISSLIFVVVAPFMIVTEFSYLSSFYVHL